MNCVFIFCFLHKNLYAHSSYDDIVLSNVHVKDLKIAITKLALIIYDQCLTIT